MFIHDRYIFASILNHSILRDLLAYTFSSTSSRGAGYRALNALSWLSLDKEFLKLLSTDFYEKLDMERHRRYSGDEIARYLKTYPSMEYAVRAYPRTILESLIDREFVWFIPFKNIKRISKRKYEGREYLEIIYTCPITGKNRIFRTYYDPETYEIIKQLCMFNDNRNCSE